MAEHLWSRVRTGLALLGNVLGVAGTLGQSEELHVPG